KITPSFHDAGRFSEGLACVQPLLAIDNRCTVSSQVSRSDYYHRHNLNPLDDISEELTELAYVMDHYADSSAWIQRYWGYTDVNGKVVIPAKFDFALPFSNGRAYVRYRGKWGVIDKTGKWIFAPVMDLPWYMSSEVDLFMRGVTRDREIPWYFEEDYDQIRTNIYSFCEGMGVVFYKQHYGYIDTTGKIIVSPVYDNAEPFSLGRGAVKHQDFYGYVDRNGKEIIALKYVQAAPFGSNGLARVSIREQIRSEEQTYQYDIEAYDYYMYNEDVYGFIDTAGAFVIKAEFQYAHDFSEELALVTNKQGQKGFIDQRGKFVVQPQYRLASDMVNGYAMVVKGFEQAHFINAKGKEVAPYTDNMPPPYTRQLIPATGADERKGYKKSGEDWTIKPVFESAWDFYPVE
ncbi:MAG TPA: WG repeat-containing protein, partial [Bacteroidia bacterium]|nr:WG repeat-containing protein [Bacteroidia bacterium]